MKKLRLFSLLLSLLLGLLAVTSCTPADVGTPETSVGGGREALANSTTTATTEETTTEAVTTAPADPYETMQRLWREKGYEDPETIYVAEGVIAPSPAVHEMAQAWAEEADKLDLVYTDHQNNRAIFYLYTDENVMFVRGAGTKMVYQPDYRISYDLGRYQFTANYTVFYGVYKDGAFYEIREAYRDQILTSAELDIFYSVHTGVPVTPVAPIWRDVPPSTVYPPENPYF